MKTARLSFHGFTLVEIVLAIGVATFGLVGVLGLLNAATGTDGDAGRDTTLVSMSDYIVTEMHAVPFDALWAADPTSARNVGPSTNSPVDSTYYFTNEGAPLATATAGNSFDLLYKCVVKKTPDTITQTVSSGVTNQLKLQLQFSWPASGSAAGKAGSKTLYASIARR